MGPSSDTITISDDDSSASVHAAKRKRKADSPATPLVKVQWSEDDDDSDRARESVKKRKRSRERPSARAAKSKGSGRGRSKARAANSRRRPRAKNWELEGSSDEDPLDTVPEYIRERREEFEKGRQALHDAGLRLPPDYSDLYFSDDERLKHLPEKPQFTKLSGITPCRDYEDVPLDSSGGVIPAAVAQYLRYYQIEGVRFLHELFVYQKGGILGDDMGLGKTVQVAAFLVTAFGKTGDQRDAKRMRKYRRQKTGWFPRVLIICPGSLTQNWKNELNQWGWWVTDLYHGTGKEDVLDTARAGRLEIMITTYTTYKNNSDRINRVPWDVVVADECHQIKDSKTGITVEMNKVNALCRIGLTGTAIQNKYEELWTLLNWTNPGQFGTLSEWKHTICRPLTIGQSHDATLKQLSEARKTAIKLRDNLLPLFFLRRMKSLIADQLPKKTDKVVFCPLSDLQREAYENILKSSMVDFIRMAYNQCPCGSKKRRGWCCYKETEEGEPWKALVFPVIMSLQKLSSHFNLLIPQTGDVTDKQRRELRFLQAAMPDNWRQYHAKRESLLDLANPEFCGKWKVLRKLLKFWHEAGDKVLVFSHSVRLLRVLRHLFSNTNYSVSFLDGSLSYEERQNTVDAFNSDPSQFVFLISTKAGGVGLNITSANKVVIMDPHWNPAYDLQAQDRAYRIGQTRDVDVYRLISTGTIEEITYARQIYKQQQANIGYNATNERRYFRGVQQDASRKGEIFGIQNLLAYHGDHVVLRDIVNKTNVAEARAGVHLMEIDMDRAVADEEVEGAGPLNAAVKKEDDETGGLRHLSAMLTSNKDGSAVAKPGASAADRRKKSDIVQAILASAGVDYTHENSEVVGTSRIEDELSRQAALAASQVDGEVGGGGGGGVPERALFYNSQDATADPLQDEDDDDDDDDNDDGVFGHHHHNRRHPSSFIDYEFNPPEDVKRRQLCTMARTLGFPTAVDFALAVEAMTQEQRRNCLDLFYTRRAEALRARAAAGDADIDVVKSDGAKTEEDSKGAVKTEMKAEDVKDDEDFKVEDDGDASTVVESVIVNVDDNDDDATEEDPATPRVKRDGPKIEGSPTAAAVAAVVKTEGADVADANKVKVELPSVSVWLSTDNEDTDDEL